VARGANAGVDLLAICENPDLQNRAIDALIAAAAAGNVGQVVIKNANRRVGRLIKEYVRAARESADLSALDSAEHRAIVERISAVPVGPDPTERSGA